MTQYAVVGGAGFIGSHLVERLLRDPRTKAVTVYDNFSSGREWHLRAHGEDPRLRVIRADVCDLERLTAALRGCVVAAHLASNPDISRATTEPSVDFDEGTLLTHNVVEACRGAGVEMLLYASGSGVYGEIGDFAAQEDMGPLLPISTYGASKLAGEALICSYCHMFGLRARAFRFANVVGPRQTHGVGFDFVRRLLIDPSRLDILGNGTQRKPYVYVTDVADAVMLAASREDRAYQVYNVSTDDDVTVTRIAHLAMDCLGLDAATVEVRFGSGDRGWRGDVPVVRLDASRIRSLGWQPSRTSEQAIRDSMTAMLHDMRAGRM